MLLINGASENSHRYPNRKKESKTKSFKAQLLEYVEWYVFVGLRARGTCCDPSCPGRHQDDRRQRTCCKPSSRPQNQRAVESCAIRPAPASCSVFGLSAPFLTSLFEISIVIQTGFLRTDGRGSRIKAQGERCAHSRTHWRPRGVRNQVNGCMTVHYIFCVPCSSEPAPFRIVPKSKIYSAA